MRLLEFIEAEAPLIRTKDGDRVEAAQMLEWFLFPRPMQYARIGSLSGGERRRLYLLRTLIHQPNVLLLDEPTNDLDIQTLAVLESFLDHFAGCLVVASHDRYFLDRTVDFLLAMEDGQLGPRYPAPYASFVERQREERLGQLKRRTIKPTRTPLRQTRQADGGASLCGSSPGRSNASWKSWIARIDAFESRRKLLLDEIEKSGDNYEQLRDALSATGIARQRLDTALDRWFELSAIAETANRNLTVGTGA